MYDNSSDAHLKPSTLPMYPRLPSVDDPNWRDVAVRARSQNQTDVKRFPVDAQVMVIATVHAGDTISILPDVQYGYFVSARLGYHVGWINFKHVKLISLQPRQRINLDETKPEVPEKRDQRVAERREQMKRRRIKEAEALRAQYEAETKPATLPPVEQKPVNRADAHHAQYEAETQPTYPPKIERKPTPIARKDVNRIIDKLKSLGGFLSRR